jgi:hypothetical protein
MSGFRRPRAAWTSKFFAIVFAICTVGGSIENLTSRGLAAPPETISVDKFPIAWNPDSKLRVYAFLGCDCPVAKLYARRLEELRERFASRGIEWVGVMSNPQDNFADIEQFVESSDAKMKQVPNADVAGVFDVALSSILLADAGLKQRFELLFKKPKRAKKLDFKKLFDKKGEEK